MELIIFTDDEQVSAALAKIDVADGQRTMRMPGNLRADLKDLPGIAISVKALANLPAIAKAIWKHVDPIKRPKAILNFKTPTGEFRLELENLSETTILDLLQSGFSLTSSNVLAPPTPQPASEKLMPSKKILAPKEMPVAKKPSSPKNRR